MSTPEPMRLVRDESDSFLYVPEDDGADVSANNDLSGGSEATFLKKESASHRLRRHRRCRPWMLIVPILSAVLLLAALLLAPRQVKVNKIEPQESAPPLEDGEKPLILDLSSDHLQVNFSKILTIGHNLPVPLKVHVDLMYLYLGSSVPIALKSNTDGFDVEIPSKSTITLEAQQFMDVNATSVSKPIVFHEALLKMQEQCEKEQKVTFHMEVKFCPSFARMLCLLPGRLSSYEVPCVIANGKHLTLPPGKSEKPSFVATDKM